MPKKTLTYCCFALAALIVAGVFITATSYIQLGLAIILYPILAFIVYKTFLVEESTSVRPVATVAATVVPAVSDTKHAGREILGISDTDKREFLKFVGATSVALLLYTIVSKIPKGPLSKTMSGSENTVVQNIPGGDYKQNPPHQSSGYSISEIDDDIISFYGFINKGGQWYIMRVDTDAGSVRYIQGENDFSKSWAKRKELKYDYSNNIF